MYIVHPVPPSQKRVIILRETFLKYAFEVKKMMLVILVNMVLMSSPLLKISSL